MARVFISHASDNLEFVGEVCEWLRAEGHEPYLNVDPVGGVGVGDEWRRWIYHEVLRADAVVCAVTSKFVTSVWCAAEVGIADALGRLILPLHLDPTVDHPMLQQLQYVAYQPDPERARAHILETLRAVDAKGRRGWREGQNPYPGLDPFNGSNGVFIGRNKEVQDLVGRVRRPDGGILAIAGPSGCGKTSLLYAGLLAMLDDDPEWVVVPPWKPGDDPTSGLARAVTTAARRSGVAWTLDTVRATLSGDDRGLWRLADELLVSHPGSRRLLVTIDQAEELFTRGDDVDHLCRQLGAVIADQAWVIATIRSEYLDDLYALPGFASVGISSYLVRPLDPNMLRLVVEEPARVAGLHIDAELVSRLVADTGSGKALPLLAFTLQRLASGLVRSDHISAGLYDEIGGVQGALIRHADQALDRAIRASKLSQDEIVAGLVRLVTLDRDGRRASRPIDADTLTPAMRTAFDVLVNERLLTEDVDDQRTTVGFVHEALLTEWPPLNLAIVDQAAALHTASSVELATAEWDAAGRANHFLWDADRLTATLSSLGMLSTRGQALTGSAIVDMGSRAHQFLTANSHYVHALIRRRRRRVASIVAVLSVLLVLATAAAGVAISQQQVANEARAVADFETQVALSRLLAIRAGQLRSSDVSLAAQLSLVSYHIMPTAEALGSLLDSSATHTATRVPGSVGTNGPQPIAVRPDGHLLAVGTPSGGVHLTNISNPAEPFTVGAMQPSHANLFTLAFNRDGDMLAVGGADQVVRLYDVRDAEQPRLVASQLTGATSAIQSLAFSPSRSLLAAGSADGSVFVWDSSSLRQVSAPLVARSADGSVPAVRAVAFSPDGNTIATGGADGVVRLWNVSEPRQPVLSKQSLTGPKRTVFALAVSPDGRTLAAGDADGNVWLWNAAQVGQSYSASEPLPGLASFVNTVAFTADGTSLAAGSSDGTVLVWNLETRQVTARLPHPAPVTAVAFTPDGRTLATGATDGATRLWTLPGPVLTGPKDRVFNLIYDHNGRTLAAGGNDGRAWMWDVTNPKQPELLNPLETPTGDDPFGGAIAFSPDGRLFAAGSTVGSVQLWDFNDRRRPVLLGQPIVGSDTVVESVVFSPGGDILAAGYDDGTVSMWSIDDPQQPQKLAQLTGPKSFIFQIAFNPTGELLAAASDDRRVWLWDIANPAQPRLVLQPLFVPNGGVRTVAFSPNGTVLAAGSDDGMVRLWDTTDMHSPRPFERPLAAGPGHPVWLAFSPSGTTMASGNTDHTISLWAIDGHLPPRLQATLTAANDNVFSLAFSPDGRFLAAAGLGRTVRLWNTDPQDVATSICATAGRPITKSEWDQYVPRLPYRPPC